MQGGGCETEELSGAGLSAEVEFFEDRLVAIVGRPLQVIQQLAPAGNHHKQTAPRSVVLGVGLEMFRELEDALAQNGHLYVGATRIFIVEAECPDFASF